MSTGTAKIQLLLDLKNRVKAGLTSAKEQINGSVNAMKTKLDELGTRNSELFDAISERVPGASEALGSLVNPYAAIGAVTAAVGAAAYKLAEELFRVSAEIQEQQNVIKATFGVTGDELDKLSAKVIATSRVFGTEVKELSTAANALYKEFQDTGLTATQSMGLVQKSLIATNGLVDVDQIREYSTQLKSVGLNAEEAVGFISAQVKQGVFSDKGVDTIKEAGLRIREMTPATKEALKAIGLNGDQITKQLSRGSKNVFDIIQEVSGALKGVNVSARQSAIANIFGSPGEDVGINYLYTLKEAKKNINDLIDLQDPFIKTQIKRLELEEKIVAKQQEFAPILNDVAARFSILKSEAQLLFFDTIGKGGAQAFAAISNYILDAIQAFRDLYQQSTLFRDLIGGLKNVFSVSFSVANMFVKALWNLITLVWEGIQKVKEGIFGAGEGFENFYNKVRPYLFYIGQYLSNIYDISRAIMTLDFSQAGEAAKRLVNPKSVATFRKEMQDEQNRPAKPVSPMPTTGGVTPITPNTPAVTTPATPSNKDVSKVTGTAPQTRNFTFNQEAMIKMGDFISKNPEVASMNKRELEAWFTEICKRVIISLEQSYG